MYQLKIYLTICFLLFISKLGFSQDPINTYTVTPQNGACISTGSITIKFPAPPSGSYQSNWTAELKIVGSSSTPTSIPIPTNGSDVVFTSLSPNDYSLQLTNGFTTSIYASTSNPIKITTTYKTMVPVLTSIAPTCKDGNDGKLTITIPVGQGVGPFRYTVTSPANGIQTFDSPNRTHTFLGMKDAESVSYSVKDLGCNVEVIATKVLASNTNIDVRYATRGYNYARECGDGDDCKSVKLYINLDPATIDAARLASIQLPGNATIKIGANPTLYPLKFLGLNAGAYRFTYEPGVTGGPKLYDLTEITTSINWGCKSLTRTSKVQMLDNYLEVFATPRVNLATCIVDYRLVMIASGGNEIDRGLFVCEKNTLKVEYRTPGTETFTTIYPDPTKYFGSSLGYSSVATNIIGEVSRAIYVDNPGLYRITVKDDCQVEYVKNYVINPGEPILGVNPVAANGIVQGTAAIDFGEFRAVKLPMTVEVERVDGQTSMTINPSNPLNLANSYTINFPLKVDFANTSGRIVDLPPGNYRLKMMDNCTGTSGTIKTVTINLTTAANYNPQFSVQEACLNSNSINYALNPTSAFPPSNTELRIRNADGSEGALVASNSGHSGNFINLPSGNYYVKFVGAGNVGFYSAAQKSFGPFFYRKALDIAPYKELELDISTVFCNPNDASSGIVSAEITSGNLIYPVTMALYRKSDVNTPLIGPINLSSPKKGHVFTGLSSGDYFIKTTSACFNFEKNFTLSVSSTPPTAKVSEATVCPGSPTTVAAISATNNLYDITWLIKKPDNTETIVGTGMPINLTPSVTTTYTARFQLKSIYACGGAVPAVESDVTVYVSENPDIINTKVSDINLCSTTPLLVDISNTQANFTYEIINSDGLSFSPKVTGTSVIAGSISINIPSYVTLTPGNVLKVRASNGNAGCTGILNDEVFIGQSTANSSVDVEGSSICASTAGTITIKNSEQNVTYTVLKAGNPLSPSISAVGTGSDLTFTIPVSNLTAASNEYTIRALGIGCAEVILTKKALITIIQAPIVSELIHAVCGVQKGKIVLNTVGGSGNYEYSLDNVNWVTSNTFTDLEPGTYTVYVKDKTLGCTKQNSVIILNQCLEISKISTTNPNSYQKVGDVLNYSITVKNNGTANLSNITVKDPLTGFNETIASLAVGASKIFTTSYTVKIADQGNSKVDNTATATFSYGANNYDKLASASVPNGLVLTDLDCSANSYSISGGIVTTLDVLIPYTGGTAASYAAGQPINLGNGTLTATLQAGTINPDGGNLVYRIVGTSATNNKVILPVVFGGKSCQVEIFIYEPNVSTIDFTINTYNDKNKNCVKDAGESQSDVNTNGLFIKIYDLNNKLVYSNPAFSGQFDVQSFSGLSDVIYYFIIDNNETESDISPNLLKGWSTGMPAPSLKRYFQYSAGAVYFNTSPVSNLSDASWDAGLQRICLSQEEGTVTSLDCSNAVFSATIKKNDLASGTITVNYLGANGGYYAAQTIASTGITGLTATLSAGSFNDGAGSLIFNLSGTPTVAGAGKFSLNIGGQTCEVTFTVLEASINITKVATQNSFKLPGEVLDYVITVKNTGTADLTNIKVSDPLTGMIENITSLVAGASKSFTTQYTVKITDLEAGKIENTAKLTYAFAGQTLEASASKSLNAIYPSISITKTATQNSYKSVGDVLNYTITVSNTGLIDLTNIQVIDPLTGMNETLASLSAGVSKKFTTSYTVKLIDLTAGKIDNIVKASFNYAGKTHEQTAVKTVNAVYPTISITKKASQISFGIVGDVLNYIITVKNTGNIDLSNIQVIDPLTGMNEAIVSLIIGESKSFNTSYTIKQSDINAGKVDNIAKADYSFEGTNYSPQVTETVVFVKPKSLIKASNDDYSNKPLNILESGKLGNVLNNDKLNGVIVKGSEVNITVTNNGGLPGLSIDADGNITVPIGSAVGTYVINYTICEKTHPSNCSEASVTLELIHGVNLRIFKSVQFANAFEGNELEYLLKVENNGNTNATNVVAIDNLPQGLSYISSTISGGTALTTVKDQQISWTFANLAAGASVEIKLRVKATPLSNGMGQTIVNTAQVSSKDTELSPRDNNASATIRIDPFFIPNTITPNGDMTNDTFEIPGLGRFVSNELVIFNRWNDEVFKAKNYQNNWAAAGLVSGTYFYILKTKDEAGKIQDYKGFVQVVKESIR